MCAFELTADLRRRPLRPALPPLLLMALGLWAAAAAAFSAGQETAPPLAPPFAAGTALAVSAVVFAAKFRRMWPWALVGAGLGLMLGCAGAVQVHGAADWLDGETVACEVELLGDATEGGYGYSAPAAATVEGRTVKVRLTGLEEPVFCGQRLCGRFSFARPSPAAAAFYWQNGFALRALADDFQPSEAPAPKGWLMALRQRAIEGISGSSAPGASLIATLACGWRPGIAAEGAYDQFKWSGTAHLVAVSGAHLALVAFAVEALAKRARLGRKARTALLCLLVAVYVLFAGMPVSALRSAFMVVAALLAALAKRRGASLNALGICVLAFVALEPSCALSVSFALSAGSTLGILLFSQKIASWFWFVPERFSEVLVAPVALTLSSQIATLSLGCALFSQFSTVALPCNVLAAPLFAPAVMGSLACAVAVALAPAAAPLCWLAAAACAPLRWLVGLFSAVPGACVAVDVAVVPALALSLCLAAILYGCWRWVTGRVALAAAAGASLAVGAVLFALPLFTPPQLAMLDVGQGDALLVASRGRNVLVDTGQEDRMLLAALARHNVRHLDAVVVTHSDRDHYGSLPALHPYVAVEAVYAHEGVLACPCENCGLFREAAQQLGCEVRGLKAGDAMQVGDVTLEVVGPLEFASSGGNDDSLCLLGTAPARRADGWRFLLTGDAEAQPLAKALAAFDVGNLDLVKVGHHGSKNALSAPILEATAPEVGLISVGEGNSYGHPHPSTLQLLEEAGAQVLRTDVCGDVTASFSPQRIELRIQQAGGPE